MAVELLVSYSKLTEKNSEIEMNLCLSATIFLLVLLVAVISSEKYEHITDCILDSSHQDTIKFVCDPNKQPMEFVNRSEISCRYYHRLIEESVPENGLPKIQFWNCRNFEQLSMLLKWNRAVQSLDIQSTGVQSIDNQSFEYAKNLSILDASRNELVAVPSSLFRYTKKISVVNFSSNKIKTIDPMAFDEAMNLSFLDLSNNLIEEIDNRTFTKLYQLESLDLSGNSIFNIQAGLFDDLNKLKYLMLSRNGISQFQCSVFTNLVDLYALHVNENKLQEFNTSCIRSNNTIYLSIDGNQLRNFTLLTNLREVHASANRINWIFVHQDLPDLLSLKLSKNRIENIPHLLNGLTSNLRELDISDSVVGALNSSTLVKFKKLKVLSLQNTSLSYIATDAFRNQHNLATLDLSKNMLKKIDFGMVDWHMESLEYFYLDGNRLENLDNFGRIKLPILKFLSIDNNNFTCGYLTEFVRQLEKENRSTIMPPIVRDEKNTEGNINGIACYNDSNSAENVTMFNVKLMLLFCIVSSSYRYILSF